MNQIRRLCPRHEALLDHTAAAIVSIASAAHPDDPIAATELALAAVGLTATIRPRNEPVRPMDTSDLDPETGEEYGVGPDYDYELETADEAREELIESGD